MIRRSLQIGVLAAMLCSLSAAQQSARRAMTGPPIDIAKLSAPLTISIETAVARQLTSSLRPTLIAWKVASGLLPDGLQLTPEGILLGKPTRAGTFAFRLSAQDANGPASYAMTIVVPADLISITWRQAPRVQGENINGSALFSSRLSKPADITVIIVAVNEVNKAFALGYQHFKFAPGSAPLVIPFGSLLPFGKYIIHADAVAEIPPKSIYRARQQTTAPLTIVQQ